MIALTRYCFFCFVFFLALLPEDFGFRSKSLPDISLIRAILLLMSVSFSLAIITSKRFATKSWLIAKEYSLPACMISMFFGWSIISSLLSPAGYVVIVVEIRDVMYFLLPFLVALFCLRRVRDIRVTVMLLAISASLSAMIGLTEYISDYSLYASITASDSAWNTFALEKTEFSGVLGSFPHPLAFGSFLAAALVLSMLVYFNRPKISVTLIVAFIGVLCLLGIFVSTSRGAQASLVGGAAVGLVLIIARDYRRIASKEKLLAFLLLFLPVFLVVSVGVAAIGYVLVKGDSENQEKSAMLRVAQLGMSVPLIEKRPILGYGAGQAAATLGMKAKTVDNYYLTVALESGLVGLALFLGILGYFLLQSVKSYMKCRHPYFLVMAVFFTVVSTQLLVLSLKQTLPLLYIGFAIYLVIHRNRIGNIHSAQ